MQPIEHNYSEKRDFIRMKLDTPVTIRCEGRESVALCRDLSASGLLLEAQSEAGSGRPPAGEHPVHPRDAHRPGTGSPRGALRTPRPGSA